MLNYGNTVRGMPYGWNKSGHLLGNTFGINNDGNNISANDLCWINPTPMPNKFELYQTIDSLPAGEYLIRCRLAVLRNRVTNQRLFANNNVQYFGSKSDYESNLTEGVSNTFAGWLPISSFLLKEMAVKVTIYQG